MRVALPIWEGRVSPVFDVAGDLYVAEVNAQAVDDGARHTVTATDAATRAKAVAELGVEVLICGAISQAMERMLQSRGVRVIARKCGEVDELLNAYRVGRLDASRYNMPGCRPRAAAANDAGPDRRAADGPEPSEATCCDEVIVRLAPPAEGRTDTARRWLAEVGTRCVGALWLDHDRKEAWVRRFDVDPRWQRGPAPCRLIQEALRYCRRRGLIKVTVEAPIRSRRAMRLFACLGFQRNHRSRPGAEGRPEFYLNLYRPVDETRCAGDIAGPASAD